jgi:hypothetical protein
VAHHNGISYVFGRELDEVFSTAADSEQLFIWLALGKLKGKAEEVYQLPVSPDEESSIRGTYAVHKDIFQDLSCPDSDDRGHDREAWTRRLWIVIGDNTTIERIRSAKADSVEYTLSYDRREWFLVSPTWFHTAVSCAFAVIGTYASTNWTIACSAVSTFGVSRDPTRRRHTCRLY